MVRRSPILRIGLFGLLALGVAVFVCIVYAFWSICISTHYSAPGLRLNYEVSGMRNTVSFEVRDSDGQPVPGVTVLSEDYSGSVWGTTDTKGKAVNIHTSGEATVVAVTVNGQRIQLRPGMLIEDVFAPSLLAGVKVTVELSKE